MHPPPLALDNLPKEAQPIYHKREGILNEGPLFQRLTMYAARLRRGDALALLLLLLPPLLRCPARRPRSLHDLVAPVLLSQHQLRLVLRRLAAIGHRLHTAARREAAASDGRVDGVRTIASRLIAIKRRNRQRLRERLAPLGVPVADRHQVHRGALIAAICREGPRGIRLPPPLSSRLVVHLVETQIGGRHRRPTE